MTMPHHVIDPVQLDRLKRCSRTFSRIIQNCPKYSSTLTEIKVRLSYMYVTITCLYNVHYRYLYTYTVHVHVHV